MKQTANRDQLAALLRENFADARAKNSAFSLRAFARKLRLQPSTVSEILNGKRRITYNLATRIIDHLAIPPDTATTLLKEIPLKQVRRKKADPAPMNLPSYTQLKADEFNVIADWFYFAVLSLAETSSFHSDAQWVSKRLAISKPDAKKALMTLERLGYLTRVGKKVCATGRNLAIATSAPHPAIKKNHSQGLELAQRALDLPLELREFGGTTIVSDPSLLPLAKKKIREFKKEITALLESGPKTQVYRMGIQFFPLSQEIKR